jgi:hypothetical protein
MIYPRQQHALMIHRVLKMPNDKGSLFISWQQRVSKKAEVVGTSYFVQTPYTRNREGMKRRALNSLIAASKRAA